MARTSASKVQTTTATAPDGTAYDPNRWYWDPNQGRLINKVDPGYDASAAANALPGRVDDTRYGGAPGTGNTEGGVYVTKTGTPGANNKSPFAAQTIQEGGYYTYVTPQGLTQFDDQDFGVSANGLAGFAQNEQDNTNRLFGEYAGRQTDWSLPTEATARRYEDVYGLDALRGQAQTRDALMGTGAGFSADVNQQRAYAAGYDRDIQDLQDLRGQQGQQSGYLQDVMMGRAGPSLAEQERMAALEQSQRQNLAQAASSRQAGGYRAALQANTEAANTASRDAMIARANEATVARQQYGDSLVAQNNTTAQIGQARAGQSNTYGAATDARTGQVGAYGAAATAGANYSGAAGDAANRAFGRQVDIADAAATRYGAQTQSNQSAIDLYNTGMDRAADLRVSANEGRQDAKQRQLDAQRLQFDAISSDRDYVQDTRKFNADARRKQGQGFIGAATSMLGAVVKSDVRAKENIRPVSAQQIQQDVRQVPMYTYDYKDPYAPGRQPGRQLGPMAQDLAQTQTYAPAVQRGPDGQLAIDPNRLTIANTAAQRAQQEKIDELQAQVEDLETKKRKRGYFEYDPEAADSE